VSGTRGAQVDRDGARGGGARPGPDVADVTDPGAPAGPVRVDLVFEPGARRVRVPHGVTMFDAASWNGIAIDSTCGGHGTCKKCKVKVLDRPAEPSELDVRAFTHEELRGGWRLACRALAVTDTTVEVPPLVTRPKAATVGVGRQVILRPAVQKRYLELAEPSLADQATDLERVLAAMDDLELRVDLPVLRSLGRVLRTADYKVTAVVVDDVLIAVEPGDTSARRFGIAYDLGTTTVVATLLDLSTGTPVAVDSVLNAQQPFGADVITRISATMLDPAALGRLTGLAQQTLAELAAAVCERGGADPAEVYEVALAGNATMTHLALGIDPEPLGGGAVHHVHPPVPRGARRRSGHRRAPARPRGGLPRLRRLRRRRHHRGPARFGHGPRLAHPAVRRHRDQLRDRASATTTGCSPPRRRPARVRGGRHPVRHAGRRRRDRSGHDDAGHAGAEGHRGRRAGRACAGRAWSTP
jgi:ferredoxin